MCTVRITRPPAPPPAPPPHSRFGPYTLADRIAVLKTSLLALENVVLLPHLGSADAETRLAMGMKALANVEAFAKGEPLPDKVA